MPNSQYSTHLDKNEANYSPLSPLTFIERAAAVYPERCALVYGMERRSWAETYRRCRRFASALQQHGLSTDDTVVNALFSWNTAVPGYC